MIMPRAKKQPKAEPPKKRGRPKKQLNYEAIEKLASIHCTQDEIASFLGVSVKTLQRDAEFCRLYKKGMDEGRMSLRRTQFKLAERNPAMAIFLGKQYLGQTDKVETTIATIDDNLRNEVEDFLNDVEAEEDITEDQG
jgi:hypothetical protein